MVLMALGGFSTIWFAQVYSPASCKAEVRETKRVIQEQRIKEVKQKLIDKKIQKSLKGPDIFGGSKAPSGTPQSPGKSNFGSVFDPGNLDKAGPQGSKVPEAQSPGRGAFGTIFDPGNLKKVQPKSE